jgi:predicted amidohydrolase
MKPFKIELAQTNPVVGDREANCQKMIEIAEKSRANMIVFGELCTTGYSYEVDLRSMAGESKEINDLAESQGKYIAYGTPIIEEGKLYNSLVLSTPYGVEVYRKIHLPNFGPFREKEFFSEGSELKVVNSEFAKLGLMICYDVSFPELARALMLKGAEVLMIASASPIQSRTFFEKVLPARAAENLSFLIFVNICGKQGDLCFWGGSRILNPWGEELAKAKYFEEDRVSAEIGSLDLERARGQRPMIGDIKRWLFNH